MTDALTCPECGAVARSAAAWCSLCFAQLQAEFDPLTAPLEQLLGEGSGAVLTQQAPAPAPAAWSPELPDWEAPADPPAQVFEPMVEPVTVAPSDPVESADSQISDVDVMLAMLAAEHRQSEPTSVLADRMGDKGARVVVIVGGTIAIALVAFVVMAVLGALT